MVPQTLYAHGDVHHDQRRDDHHHDELAPYWSKTQIGETQLPSCCFFRQSPTREKHTHHTYRLNVTKRNAEDILSSLLFAAVCLFVLSFDDSYHRYRRTTRTFHKTKQQQQQRGLFEVCCSHSDRLIGIFFF